MDLKGRLAPCGRVAYSSICGLPIGGRYSLCRWTGKGSSKKVMNVIEMKIKAYNLINQ